MRLTSTIAASIGILIALYQPSLGAPVKLPPAETQIIKAVDRILAHPLQPSDAADIAKIVDYSNKTDRITITLDQAFVYISEDDRDRLCFGFYIAGATKFRLLHPEDARNKYADVLPALRAGLVEYRAIKTADRKYQNKRWDRVDQLDRAGQLPRWVEQTIEDKKNKSESPKTS